MSGLAPVDTRELNVIVGGLLRQFVNTRAQVQHAQNWLAANDITLAPYSLSAPDAADMKSAVSGLNTSLQAVDMTFINRVTGIF